MAASGRGVLDWSLNPRAGIRVWVSSAHSADSRHGCAAVPGATGPPAGSGGNSPAATVARTAGALGSLEWTYCSTNWAQDLNGGCGRALSPNGTVTLVTPKSAVTVPWNGGPSRCRS